MDLFNKSDVIGVFRGFREGGLEFHADVVLPYQNQFQRIPMHGQFLLVQLETPDEAVLGRITALTSQGRLSSGSGEEFNIRAVEEDRPIPEDLREQYLRYAVNIRVLGLVRREDNIIRFVPSQRRLPHVGSKVAFPSWEALQQISGHNNEGAPIGMFALGEYVYAKDSVYADQLIDDKRLQVIDPAIEVKFPIEALVSRRSFIFARAGFGKSNLNKLLFSLLYKDGTPTVTKRGHIEMPVGTIIFDPDGEYFWPDDRGRPGLADVPGMEDKLVVFTQRKSPSQFYQSFVAGGIRLDLRRLRPSDVVAIALSPDRQDQQNVRKLRALSQQRWEELVNLIHRYGNQAPLEEVYRALDLERAQEAEALAARANMTQIVGMLHDPSSQLMDLLFQSLQQGKLCVVDVSQMRSGQALILSGIILRKIFDHNQEKFTEATVSTIPTIAVVEEAQAVLNERASAADPYIAWVKEGRKYDLGALLITQQPGSIPMEILSQGDNWFVFHLLSGTDLNNIRNANAHFSNDILSALLNEPIPGHGIFWSSSNDSPYPIPIRVLSFEAMFELVDPDYNGTPANTFASVIRSRFQQEISAVEAAHRVVEKRSDDDDDDDDVGTTDEIDVLETYAEKAIRELSDDAELMRRIRSDVGVAWGSLNAFVKERFPESFLDREAQAYHTVPKALNRILGPQGEAWESYKNEDRNTTYVRILQ